MAAIKRRKEEVVMKDPETFRQRTVHGNNTLSLDFKLSVKVQYHKSVDNRIKNKHVLWRRTYEHSINIGSFNQHWFILV